VANVLPDTFKTILLFLGGLGKNPNNPIWGSKPSLFQEDQNIQFIKEATGYEWKVRPNHDKVYYINESLIKSGDFFSVIRFNGNDVAIEYGSGSTVGHSTMALWMQGELYIVESQGGHWPKDGLQKNLFKDWMKYAEDAGYCVTWMPLKQEYRDMFNEEAVIEWFNSVEGMPYGFETFLFGWIDTPDASYPPVMDPEYLAAFFAFFEKDVSEKAANNMYTPGMNWRLGTNGLNVSEIALVVAERGLNFADLHAIVEQDYTWYGDHYAFTCSGFVTALYKKAGLFGNLTINGVEWTPRDIYQSVLIDPSPVVPEDCKALDPENPFCQIMGRFRMQFPGISSVPLYSHMNEHCPSEPPLYLRTPGC